MSKHISLFHVSPETSKEKFKTHIENAKEYLSESGRRSYTNDELVFIALMDQTIELYERAKSMLARERFTVEFAGDKNAPTIYVQDFAIIPIQKKD